MHGSTRHQVNVSERHVSPLGIYLLSHIPYSSTVPVVNVGEVVEAREQYGVEPDQ